MKQTAVALLLLILSCCTFAQSKTLHSAEDLVVAYSKLNKAKDTFWVNGIYHSFGKARQREAVITLNKKRLVNRDNCRTGLSVSLFGANKKYYLPYIDTKTDAPLFDKKSMGKQVLIQIILFKDLKTYNGEDFFLINQVKLLE